MAAKLADVTYIGSRLLGLSRRVDSGDRPIRDTTYPVVRCQRHVKEPSLYAYADKPAGGRRHNRIRHVYRKSRAFGPRNTLSIATLNTQGMSWHHLGHRDKLLFLLQYMRQKKLDLISLSEMHATQGPCVVHLEEFVLVTNNKAAWLMTLEMYVHWSESQYMRWDGEENTCAVQIPLGERVYIFVSVYMRPSNLVKERRQALADLDAIRQRFPADAVEVIMGDWNAHGGDAPG